MQIKEEKHGEILVVAIDDHLDTAAAPALETRLIALIDAGARKLVIDCAKLEYVNSAGLKVFLLVAKKLESGGQLVLCALVPSVQMIFEMIGFAKIMKIVATREEALQLIGDTPGAA